MTSIRPEPFVPQPRVPQPDVSVLRNPLLFPEAVALFIAAGMLDFAMTSFVITVLGAAEVNPIARIALDTAGVPALAVLKLATIGVVVSSCQLIGRRDERRGRQLANIAAAVAFFPVMFTVGQMISIVLRTHL